MKSPVRRFSSLLLSTFFALLSPRKLGWPTDCVASFEGEVRSMVVRSSFGLVPGCRASGSLGKSGFAEDLVAFLG